MAKKNQNKILWDKIESLECETQKIVEAALDHREIDRRIEQAKLRAATTELPANELQQVAALIYAKAKRSLDGLKIYEPLPVQQQFHASKAIYRIVRGSNRSGKTLAAAVEVARAVTNQDPYNKYPKEGVCVIVGKDQKHISKVLYPKLFLPGAFKIIRDLQTNTWRTFHLWEPADANRINEVRKALPLISPRYVESIAWENKKADIPLRIDLTTGWQIYFHSSLGKPPQGMIVDLFWFDEEIVDPNWYIEMSARVLDRHGKGIWSATPQAGTDQLYELHDRAHKESSLPPEKRRVEEFLVLLEDNKHISEEAKRAFAADLTEEEARVRIGGEFAVLSYKVYPSYSKLVHSYPKQEIPNHWSLYAYVDPGHVTCGVLFCAVPPPSEIDMILLWHELYLYEASAHLFGEAMYHACRGRQFEAFVIDYHMGVHTEIGTGKTVLSQYTEALQRFGVRSRQTGHSFLCASDDIRSGVLAVKELLRVRENGTPKLRVMEDCLPNFEYEIKRYHRKRINGILTEEPDNRKDNHLMDCLRYLALHGPKYVKLRKEEQIDPSSGYANYRRKIKSKMDKQLGGSVIFLGPGTWGTV